MAPGTSSSLLHKRPQEDEAEEDSIQLVDDAESLELIEFDPSIEPKGTWDPPPAMANFLEELFNWTLEMRGRPF